MFRLYDNVEEEWIYDACISIDGTLLVEKKTWYGLNRIIPATDEERYILHKEIGMLDMHEVVIFEGDICKLEFDAHNVVGLITYVNDHAAYYLLDYENNMYYPMRKDYHDYIEVIGNIIEDKELLGDNVIDERIIAIHQ